MLKREEILHPDSCWNKAEQDEPVFVLLGRDVAAIATISHWIAARMFLKKNKPYDQQLERALELCERIIRYQASISSRPEPTTRPGGVQRQDSQ